MSSNVVKFYSHTRGPLRCLSNFSEHSFVLRGKTWPTTEHYFQALKFEGSPEEETVRLAATPAEAKRLGRTFSLRPDWEEVKIGIMMDALRAKFTQNLDAKEVLLSTGDSELQEDAKDDAFWGIGKHGRGRNELGKLLVQLREELKRE
ncbi:hypothetical protein HK105_207592 [Polyrhizophydium stewartii]|uniref:NADAR domain-containing protein n=1 Tax=Polyrhizophydium stewartii TaxID=2732419 RepID=A0ABR4N077_9FUNG|nr:hypothetical protein HK105_004690 [Polyrhizophydium stewartii]